MTGSLFSRLLAPLAASLLVAACGGEVAAPPQPAAKVTVVTLKAGPVTLFRELPGRASPFRVAEVRPQVTGIIDKRLFTEGSQVKQGQALYQIDDASYRAAANSARAQLARAEASLTSARLRAKRIGELALIEAVSVQDNEDAIAALKLAEADVGAARADLDSANVILAYARISAPISGRIGKSSVTQGALVTANQTMPLATVHQLDPIYIDLTQSSAELLQLRRALDSGSLQGTSGLPVTILLEDGSEFSHKGTLEFAEVSVDPATGSFNLRVKVDNPQGLIMPGMYVRALLGSGLRENAILVPMQGITRDPKGKASAMVVDGEGKVAVHAVEVSTAIGDKWLVEDGLKAGDKVIVEGLQKIGPGMPVQFTEKGVTPAAAPRTQPDAAKAAAPAPKQ
ncbi:MAG: efflux RND transporter periplasmic adaptor subunit [Dokdonella sp.]|uniref:efflux RND transporter periplasmic adaptor subunit n=1 Tax=Dokdonella sp. TaxID=2291710 RepID=UPI003BB13CBB